MVDNNIRTRAPSANVFSPNNNSPQSPQALAKSFEKLSNKPDIAAQVSKDAIVVQSTSSGTSKLNGEHSGIKNALKSTKEAVESVKKLQTSEGRSGSIEVKYAPVGIEELAKDLESLKENIKSLFAQLRTKSDTVAVADANAEAAQSQTGSLDKVLRKAEDTGLDIQFKPKSALSAHSNRISPDAVEKLLIEERGLV